MCKEHEHSIDQKAVEARLNSFVEIGLRTAQCQQLKDISSRKSRKKNQEYLQRDQARWHFLSPCGRRRGGRNPYWLWHFHWCLGTCFYPVRRSLGRRRSIWIKVWHLSPPRWRCAESAAITQHTTSIPV